MPVSKLWNAYMNWISSFQLRRLLGGQFYPLFSFQRRFSSSPVRASSETLAAAMGSFDRPSTDSTSWGDFLFKFLGSYRRLLGFIEDSEWAYLRIVRTLELSRNESAQNMNCNQHCHGWSLSIIYVYIYTWNSKQPVFNGCLVKQPFFM